MTDFLVKVLLSLTTFALTGICTWLIVQVKNYKKLLKEKDDNHLIEVIDEHLEEKLQPIRVEIETLKNVDNRIDEKLKPIHVEIGELQKEIAGAMHDEEQLKIQLVGSYRFRLIQLCKRYIAQKYMTPEQYDQLSEFFKMYEVLGGNGQAKEYYDKARALPVVQNIDLVNKNIEE